MGDLTLNFSRSEFRCRGDNCCGGAAPLDMLLVYRLQELRHKLAAPLIISSGFRCLTHNARIGGSANSQHCKGFAADLLPPDGMEPEDLARLAESLGSWGGIGVYPTFVHLDIRETPARWRR